MENFSIEKILDKFYQYLPTLLVAVVILIVGIILIKIVEKVMSKALNNSKIDITAHSFLKSLVKVSLYTILIIMVLSQLGIPTTSLVTIVGAAGLAVGFALQTSMGNLAGGFIILFSKPFKVGDYIEIGSSYGKVDNITILHTRLLTADNKAIYIPNGQISSSTLTNYTQEDKRRLDLIFTIGYKSDFNKAKEILADIISKNPLAIKEPEPIIRISEQATGSIKIAVKVWVKHDDYSNLHFDLNEEVKARFDEENISPV